MYVVFQYTNFVTLCLLYGVECDFIIIIEDFYEIIIFLNLCIIVYVGQKALEVFMWGETDHNIEVRLI